MIPTLVTLTHAKEHIKPSTAASDNDLKMQLYQATKIVANHIKITDIPQVWFSSTPPADIPLTYVPTAMNNFLSPPQTNYVLVPGNVISAIILVAAELFEKHESSTSNPLSDSVLSLLEGFRTPTLA